MRSETRLIAVMAAFLALASAMAMLAVARAGELGRAWSATEYCSSGLVEHVIAVPPYLAGRSEAAYDIRKGNLRLKFWGLISPTRDYNEVLQRRYGIRGVTVAGCVVNSVEQANWMGYNEVMTAEINRRYGPRALEDAWDEVAQARRAK